MQCKQCNMELDDAGKCPQCDTPGQEKNPLATASLVLGILGFIVPAGFVGLVLGLVALRRIKNSAGHLGGKGIAIAGIISSSFMTPIGLAIFLLPVFSASTDLNWNNGHCMSQQRKIAYAVLAYYQEHGDTLPTAETVWNDCNIEPLLLMCPSKYKVTNGYGYNSYMSKKNLGDASLATPISIILTADGGDANNLLKSAADIDATRHIHNIKSERDRLFTRPDGFIASYVDGHVEFLRAKQASLVILKPEIKQKTTE
ncbi:MAG: DUF4190 domain-containing protein [bacterium]